MNILSRLFLILLVAVCEMTTISDTTYAQNPTPIATFEREEVGGGGFGLHMAHGDINGDGTDDLIASATHYAGAGYVTGRVYVFFGRSFSGAISASTADIKITGPEPVGPQPGTLHVVRTGDFDGDSFSDLVIASPTYFDSTVNGLTGRVYVFLGKRLKNGGNFGTNEADLFFYGDSCTTSLSAAVVFDFDGDKLDDIFLSSGSLGPFCGQNRLSVFYAKNLIFPDSLYVRDADAYFYGGDSSQSDNSIFTFIGNDNLRYEDLNDDGVGDLVTALYHNTGGVLPDTVCVLYGQPGGYYGGRNFNDADIVIPNGYDKGAYAELVSPIIGDFDSDQRPNVIIRNARYHYDPDYNNQFGRVYMFKQLLENGMTLEDATTKIRGTIAGILSGNFGLQMHFGDVDGDQRNEVAVADNGYGYTGAQFLFKGREDWPDSLSDMDADVKILGNASYSGLFAGVMLADILGTGKTQWLVAYGRSGNRIDGFVDLYPSSVLTGIEEPVPNPRSLVLHPNYPNPFNPSTTISYELPSAGHVELSVYNVLGQEVRRLVDSKEPSGYHRAIWDGKNDQGRNVASGIYIVALQFGNDVKTRKIMLLK